jgi:hypothetical protein
LATLAIDPDDSDTIALVDAIRGRLDRVNDTLRGSGHGNEEWTSRIKRELVALGKSHGVYACASGVEVADHGEWLYDVCWLRYVASPERLIAGMPLALECEWRMGGGHVWIMEDFQKICLARAEIKWMVCQGRDDEACRSIGDLLARQAMLLRSATDGRYFLSCWNAREGRFAHAALDTDSGRLRSLDDALSARPGCV